MAEALHAENGMKSLTLNVYDLLKGRCYTEDSASDCDAHNLRLLAGAVASSALDRGTRGKNHLQLVSGGCTFYEPIVPIPGWLMMGSLCQLAELLCHIGCLIPVLV